MPAIVAVFLVAWLVVKAPRAIAEMVEDLRASKAGAWEHLAAEHARRDASRVERREARRKAYAAAWAARRELRSRQAGGDGTYQPGMRAYLGDVYGGFWRRRIEVRRAKEQARGPYVHDPDRPSLAQRVDAAILGWLGRVGSAVRGQRAEAQPEPAAQPEPQVETPAATDLPPGTWTVDEHGQRVPLTEPEQTEPDTDPATEKGTNAVEYRNSAERVYDGLGRGESLENIRLNHPEAVRAWEQQQCEAAATSAVRDRATAAMQRDDNRQAGRSTTIMTAPTTTAPITVDEVTSNEALRRNFARMRDAAARAKDALAVVEAARQEIAAAAAASADGVGAKKFDANATSAAHAVNEQINLGTLSQWAETFDNAQAAAEAGHQSLEKYRDAEDTVAANNVDGSTLEPTAV